MTEGIKEDAKRGEVLAPDRDARAPLLPFEEMLEVERRRLEIEEKRFDVAKEAIKAADASDQRQYDYHMSRLKVDDDDKKRRHMLASRVFLYGGSAIFVVVFLLLLAAFLGDERQSSTALTLLGYIATGLGGGGLLHLAIEAYRKLMRR